ncbi:MalY/PatB family protein [Bacillota bacterium Lsc_1132]
MTIFDEKVDRMQTASFKWERTENIFGAKDLLPMWVADMDFRPPQAVIDALKKRVEHGIFGYTFIPESTNKAIQYWLNKRHNWKIESETILYANSVVESISVAIQTYTKPGDKVLLQSPVYTPFFEMIEKNGRVVANSPLKLNGARYDIDFETFEQELKNGCKLFLLCNPHNPGGRVWSREELLKIGELCLKYDCLIVADEIHSDLVYQSHKHYPMASLSNELAEITITCISPSKTFNLAGLQASAIVIHSKEMREQFFNTQRRHGFFSLNTFGILAMEAAYQNGEMWLEELMDYLEGNKQFAISYLAENLPQLTYMEPDATYLLWIDCRKLALSDKEIKKLLIEKGKLALEPGQKYGLGGEGFVRLNFACPREMLADALERLKKAFA